MVAKFRAQTAATPIRHYYIAYGTERIWWYSNGPENRRQGLGFASFVKLEFSSACVVCTPSSRPRQQCRFSERDFAVNRGRGMARTEERGPSMLERQTTAAAVVKGNGGKLLGAKVQQRLPSEDVEKRERSSCMMRLGMCEGTRVVQKSPKRNGERTTRVEDDIPVSEFVKKIHELKFFGDMWEGDIGPQVLDLQV